MTAIMPRIAEDDVEFTSADFLLRISPTEAAPQVVYNGPKPEAPQVFKRAAIRTLDRCYVYMFLRDGWPIYIGQSAVPAERFTAHTRKQWFDVANEYILLKLTCRDHWEARDAALSVEKAAIRMFGPSHNLAGIGAA